MEMQTLPVKVTVNRPLLHYLSNASGLSNVEVLSTIRDNVLALVERVKEFELSRSHKKSVFSNTNIKVHYSVNKIHLWKQYSRDLDEWERRHQQETFWNSYTNLSDIRNKNARNTVQTWRLNNPRPIYDDVKYNYLNCTVSVTDKPAVFEIDEIENLLIDQIFFGAEDGDQTPDSDGEEQGLS